MMLIKVAPQNLLGMNKVGDDFFSCDVGEIAVVFLWPSVYSSTCCLNQPVGDLSTKVLRILSKTTALFRRKSIRWHVGLGREEIMNIDLFLHRIWFAETLTMHIIYQKYPSTPKWRSYIWNHSKLLPFYIKLSLEPCSLCSNALIKLVTAFNLYADRAITSCIRDAQG